MFPHTVTVYNKYRHGAAEQWQRTVINGVFWASSKGAAIRQHNVAAVNGLQLIIPRSSAPGGYTAPVAWAALPDKAGTWTLAPGDTVVLGDIAAEILRSAKELEGYDDKLIIVAVDYRNYGGGMACWEVTGK